MPGFDTLLCLTSKMSHDGDWRGACASTTRDKPRRWLWRLVRRNAHVILLHRSKAVLRAVEVKLSLAAHTRESIGTFLLHNARAWDA